MPFLSELNSKVPPEYAKYGAGGTYEKARGTIVEQQDKEAARRASDPLWYIKDWINAYILKFNSADVNVAKVKFQTISGLGAGGTTTPGRVVTAAVKEGYNKSTVPVITEDGVTSVTCTNEELQAAIDAGKYVPMMSKKGKLYLKTPGAVEYSDVPLKEAPSATAAKRQGIETGQRFQFLGADVTDLVNWFHKPRMKPVPKEEALGFLSALERE